MQSISRTRELKGIAELYERILEAEGMPAEFPDDERISFVTLDHDAAEGGDLRPRAGNELSSADRAVVEQITRSSRSAANR
jgi:hypothetical protein